MNEHDESEFDDPGFKAAVGRTLGREAAPPSLRAKVKALMAAEAAGVTGAAATATTGQTASTSHEPALAAASRGGRRWLLIDRKFWRTAAAAACVLLALGWMAYQFNDEFGSGNPFVAGPTPTMTTVPASLVLEMVRTHDNCAKLPDHHKIPGDDPEKLRDKLAESGVAASATHLGGDWKFKGAGICQVGQTRAAHLLFARADEFVSVFSLLAPENCGYGPDSYTEMFEKHPVAGFRHGDALYCVVGSCDKGEFTEAELRPVLQKVQDSIASGCMTHDALAAAVSAASVVHRH